MARNHAVKALSCAALVLIGAFASTLSARGQITPSAEILMPYFAFDLAEPWSGDDTLFAVCNHGPDPTEVTLTVYSNWGVRVLTTHLRDWLELGTLPDRQLSPAELAHLRAALSGRQSPQDHLYYGSEVRPDLAVGYITARDDHGRDSLWGDFFTMVPGQRVFQADTLVNIDRSEAWNLPCKVHGVRFLEAGPFEDVGTHLAIWSAKRGIPSSEPTPPAWVRLRAVIEVYDEAGHQVEERVLSLLPAQVVRLHDLVPNLLPSFGWLQIELDTDGFVGVDFNAANVLTGGLHSYCLPPDQEPDGPGVDLEKLVNGQDADVAPGPLVPVGSPLVWTFAVRNSGSVPLSGLVVQDDSGLLITCPGDTLEPGETMTCTASSAAAGCQHVNVGEVTGYAPDGARVDDTDLAYYYGQYAASLAFLSITANGLDARTPPGPGIPTGDPVAWAFVVKNTGDGALSGVAVTAGPGLSVTCPKSSLQPDEAMTCTASGTAQGGDQTITAEASGSDPCDAAVTKATAAYYFGILQVPRIGLQKLTNGEAGDLGTGPTVLVGSPVVWTYIVTNAGDVALSAIVLTDDHLGVVACPQTVLQPGESMSCSASGTAIAGQYRNTATVTGNPPSGPPVSDEDTSQYFGISPAVALEKLVNGFEADTPPGPVVETGSALLWTYVVTNTGDLPLMAVAVSDDQGLTVACLKTTLAPGDSMTCTARSIAVAGQHLNVGTVVASWDVAGRTVTATDPANYFGQRAAIGIEKRTNGDDADVPPGPKVLVGSTVTWTYVVTNTGDTRLTAVAVSDDHLAAVTCPKTVLEAGESMTCSASGAATAGQYMNVGTAAGTPADGPTVTATDPSHYYGAVPQIAIEKLVNGQEADTPPGPTIAVGSPLLWTYVVSNVGELKLFDVAVTDDQGLAVTCPKTTLELAETMTCTANSFAAAGLHANVGTASGHPEGGATVTATDPCYYTGSGGGDQGCTPGYWKNHVGSWAATGYSSGQSVDSVFAGVNVFYPALGNSTLLGALSFAGGPGGEGAAEILLRAGVAAVLNAAHPAVAYPRTPAEVVAAVDAALVQNRDVMLALAAQLDADNNLGCPLN